MFNRNFEDIDGLLKENADLGAFLTGELARKGGGAKLGTAAEIDDLEPGGVLFLTDDDGAEGYLVTLADLLAEGVAAAQGRENRLSELATAQVAQALNLRGDGSGARFGSDEEFRVKLLELCGIAVENGTYFNDGVLSLSWKQVQAFFVDGELSTATEAERRSWFWCADGADRLAAVEEEVRALRALLGDLNGVLDAVNRANSA